MSKFDFNRPMDYVCHLADRKGDPAGKIQAYYTRAGVCHAHVRLYNWTGLSFQGWGDAGGGGYDKLSTAIAEAVRPINGGCDHHDLISNWTFRHGANGLNHATEAELKAYERKIKRLKLIPVYPGAGNHEDAFRLYFKLYA